MRAGTQCLRLLASPLNLQILQVLGEEPTPLHSLRHTAGDPAVTTMRSYLRNLADLGVIERRREDGFPGSVSFTITNSGTELLSVAKTLHRWLRDAPGGPLELGARTSQPTIKALAGGWDTGVIRALAARPLSLTELDGLISQVTYPILERRLSAMRHAGLLEPDPHCPGKITRCLPTPWLRRAVVPLTAAIGWERRCVGERASPPGREEVEAAFLLAVPLLDLPAGLEGTCRLAVELHRGSDLEFAGVTVTVVEGKAAACVTRMEEEPDAWLRGTVPGWLRGAESRNIEFGGKAALARSLRRGFTNALIPGARARTSRIARVFPE